LVRPTRRLRSIAKRSTSGLGAGPHAALSRGIARTKRARRARLMRGPRPTSFSPRGRRFHGGEQTFAWGPADANLMVSDDLISRLPSEAFTPMPTPHRNRKKANHGSRPANAKARKAKRKLIRT